MAGFKRCARGGMRLVVGHLVIGGNHSHTKNRLMCERSRSLTHQLGVVRVISSSHDHQPTAVTVRPVFFRIKQLNAILKTCGDTAIYPQNESMIKK